MRVDDSVLRVTGNQPGMGIEEHGTEHRPTCFLIRRSRSYDVREGTHLTPSRPRRRSSPGPRRGPQEHFTVTGELRHSEPAYRRHGEL
jgi:hypothetical protein